MVVSQIEREVWINTVSVCSKPAECNGMEWKKVLFFVNSGFRIQC